MGKGKKEKEEKSKGESRAKWESAQKSELQLQGGDSVNGRRRMVWTCSLPPAPCISSSYSSSFAWTQVHECFSGCKSGSIIGLGVPKDHDVLCIPQSPLLGSRISARGSAGRR